MKKVMMTMVLAFVMIASYNVSAQDTEKVEQVESEAADQRAVDLSEKEDGEYAQIDRAELPQAVQDAAATDYEGMTIAQAFQGQDGTFKIVLVAEDQRSTKTVYADASGKWIVKEEDGQ